YPQELGRGEARHGRVACEAAQIHGGRFQFDTLRTASRIVPKDAGAQHFVVSTEQRGTVHLAGEANAAHGGERPWVFGGKLVQAAFGGLPPVGRVLFRPARRRPLQGERRSGRGNGGVAVKQQRLDAGGAQVQAQGDHGRLSFR